MTITPIIAQVFADASPTNSELGLWLSCLNTAVTFAVGLALLIKYLRNDPEKREIKISPEVASKEDFEAHEEHIQTLYQRTEKVDKAVARLETETKNQNTHLFSIEAKLDRLIERGRRI